jgi:hypothetical protein
MPIRAVYTRGHIQIHISREDLDRFTFQGLMIAPVFIEDIPIQDGIFTIYATTSALTAIETARQMEDEMDARALAEIKAVHPEYQTGRQVRRKQKDANKRTKLPPDNPIPEVDRGLQGPGLGDALPGTVRVDEPAGHTSEGSASENEGGDCDGGLGAA